MKKYLMSGVAAIAFLAAFTSCSKSTDLYEEGRKEKDQQIVKEKTDAEKLTTSFETVIGGSICPTNDWGFGATVAKSSTRGIDNQNNMWAHYVNVPDVLSDDQKAVVRNWFQTHNKPEGISVNWSDFFVQQVYKGHSHPTDACPEIYTSKANQSVIGSDKMNKLTCGTREEHIEKFNTGDFNGGSPTGNVSYADPYNDANRLLTHPDYINFMINSSTECFGYSNSESSEQRNDKFVIIPGDWIDRSVAGMYFVGLDFAANGSNPNMQVDADGYYSDWIVRITPGLYRGENTWRCFAEDLIATDLSDIDESDWDYNDAVFDAYRDYTNNQTVIILHAAGGTMPLTVGGKEVHEAFGVDVNIMVNTDNNTTNRPVAIYRIPGTYNSLNDIPVMVNGSTELKAEKGENKVPMKLAVPVGTKWLKEKVIITDGYPDFANYAHLGSPANWYETRVNNGSLVSK